jgi:hypothetical protein
MSFHAPRRTRMNEAGVGFRVVGTEIGLGWVLSSP